MYRSSDRTASAKKERHIGNGDADLTSVMIYQQQQIKKKKSKGIAVVP